MAAPKVTTVRADLAAAAGPGPAKPENRFTPQSDARSTAGESEEGDPVAIALKERLGHALEAERRRQAHGLAAAVSRRLDEVEVELFGLASR